MQSKNLFQPLALAALLALSAPAFAAAGVGASKVLQGSLLSAVGSQTLTPLTATASEVSFDVAGIQSMEGWNNAANEVFSLDIGAGTRVVSVGWDVDVTAYSPSWLSELTVDFTDTLITTGVSLKVGVNDTMSGNMAYASGGQVDLIGLGLDFTVGTDGKLRLEFSEGFNDFVGAADGMWNSGTLTFGIAPIPEPGTYGLMALGLLAVSAAARRRSA